MWTGFFGIWVLYQCLKQPEKFMGYKEGDKNSNNSSNRFFAVGIKALTNLAFICLAMCSFQNALKAEMNIGIICSLFASEVVFSSLMFLIFYCRDNYLLNFLGTLVFIGGAVLIYLSMQPPLVDLPIELSSSIEQEIKSDYMHKAFYFALACGFTLAINSLIARASWHNLSTAQITLDSYITCAVVFAMAHFIYGTHEYEGPDFWKCLACCLLFTPSIFAQSVGVNQDREYQAKAIECLYVVVVLLIGMLFSSTMPTWPQAGGMLLCLFGTTVILLWRSKFSAEIQRSSILGEDVDKDDRFWRA